MVLMVLIALACASGFVLFRRNTVPVRSSPLPKSSVAGSALSVIIPARNEELNLPHLLSSLRQQTRKPDQIIVIDDFSADRTRAIAESYGVVVVDNPPLPEGWTGKNWAVWNGYRIATGDYLLFLDADVRLAPDAVQSLLAAQAERGGVLSVVPFHHTEKGYERLALLINILGIFAFTSPFERSNSRQGLYGSCILASRSDYVKAKGHEAVRSELLDDLTLGGRFKQAGVRVSNFIGAGLVSFRMYPGGIRSAIQGWGKGAVLSTAMLKLRTTLLVAVWLLGLLAVEAAPFLLHLSWSWPLRVGYAIYTLQILYFVRYTGRFGFAVPILHLLSSAFFLFIMLYSLFRVLFVGNVAWKGRNIEIGGRQKR
ncbi:glycosyltransferase [Cohnella thailandensis]|uniref:Glycosyltransferase n=1 Tax=Cohnella thailandensis TaxID=557557 RepID=A0A841T4W5_9BACL|nr:glycosyltransferase [Cohnella thailandensis]MBB6637705.1 glycosyltransferase [Cohnella thailandensis]MBP1974118.1 glycosyltransferase involved in cell wall biosynthesis [Cohnella thailandensis]